MLTSISELNSCQSSVEKEKRVSGRGGGTIREKHITISLILVTLINRLKIISYITYSKLKSVQLVFNFLLNENKDVKEEYNNYHSLSDLVALLVGASTPSMCCVERHRFELRTTHYFLSVGTTYLGM